MNRLLLRILTQSTTRFLPQRSNWTLREVERSVYAQAVADLAPAPVDRAQCLQSRVPAKPGIKFSCDIYTTNEDKRTYFVTVGDVLGNYTITPA